MCYYRRDDLATAVEIVHLSNCLIVQSRRQSYKSGSINCQDPEISYNNEVFEIRFIQLLKVAYCFNPCHHIDVPFTENARLFPASHFSFVHYWEV